MKVQADQIKRPRLIEPFFNEELTPDNEFVTYIDTSIQKDSTPFIIIPKTDFKLNPFVSWFNRYEDVLVGLWSTNYSSHSDFLRRCSSSEFNAFTKWVVELYYSTYKSCKCRIRVTVG